MQISQFKNNTGGSTLIELVIYLVISTGIIIGVGTTSLNVLEQKEKARAIYTLSAAESFVITLLSRDIQEASAVITPALPAEFGSILRLSYTNPSREQTVYEIANGTMYRTVGGQQKMAILPPSVLLTDALFERTEGSSLNPSILIAGDLHVGNDVLGNAFKADKKIQTAITVRAPQP